MIVYLVLWIWHIWPLCVCASLHAMRGEDEEEREIKRYNKIRAEWEVGRSDEQKKRNCIKASGAALLESTEQRPEEGLLTSFSAFSSLGLLSSTLSLDCCFSFLSSAVTERHRGAKRESEMRRSQTKSINNDAAFSTHKNMSKFFGRMSFVPIRDVNFSG